MWKYMQLMFQIHFNLMMSTFKKQNIKEKKEPDEHCQVYYMKYPNAARPCMFSAAISRETN
jgi:hypothetical protein